MLKGEVTRLRSVTYKQDMADLDRKTTSAMSTGTPVTYKRDVWDVDIRSR